MDDFEQRAREAARLDRIEARDELIKHQRTYVDELKAELAASKLMAENYRTKLANLVACHGKEECYFDHHGNCQAHFVENPCSVAEARAALDEESK